MALYTGFIQLGAGLSVGLAGLSAGFAIGIVGDAGVRGVAQQVRLPKISCFDEKPKLTLALPSIVTSLRRNGMSLQSGLS